MPESESKFKSLFRVSGDESDRLTALFFLYAYNLHSSAYQFSCSCSSPLYFIISSLQSAQSHIDVWSVMDFKMGTNAILILSDVEAVSSLDQEPLLLRHARWELNGGRNVMPSFVECFGKIHKNITSNMKSLIAVSKLTAIFA